MVRSRRRDRHLRLFITTSHLSNQYSIYLDAAARHRSGVGNRVTDKSRNRPYQSDSPALTGSAGHSWGTFEAINISGIKSFRKFAGFCKGALGVAKSVPFVN